MEVLIENKMIDIKSEPVEMVLDHPHHHHHRKPTCVRRRSSSSPAVSPVPPAELEPCEEFPILYGLLTAPKSFKPKNSEELQLLPPLKLFSDSGKSSGGESNDNEEDVSVRVTSRVKLVQYRRRRDSSAESELDLEEDSQNFYFSSRSSSLSGSPHTVDSSCSNLSAMEESCSINSHNEEEGDESEDESTCSLVGSPEENSYSGGDDSVDDNIPTSTTSGFKRKACRLETAIGNIVKRRVRVQKRSSNSNTTSTNGSGNVPISMAPSSPTVSTTCVDPPTPPPPSSRGRSEILERILRSTNNTTTNHQQQPTPAVRRSQNDDNNNEGSYDGPYAKLRDLLTMPEDQLVKRRRMEYGLNENNNSNAKLYHNSNNNVGQSNNNSESNPQQQRRRDFSPPRNNILASLLQKGRAPYEPTSSSSPFNHPQRGLPSMVQINGSSSSPAKLLGGNSRLHVIVNMNDERPYKCSLCDLRFKKLPLLNRHVKTHSHIKRYVCRFCSHAFKRSDNLLAHMRTSCKGIKDADTKFAGGQARPAPPTQQPQNRGNNQGGQIINQLLSAPPTAGGPVVSRSQLEEALLNWRAHQPQEEPSSQEKRYSAPCSPLVSTTTASPPPPSQRRPVDLQSRHSKLLEILSSGSPANRFPVVPVDHAEEELEEEDEEQEMPLPLSLKVDRRASSPPPTCSSSSSSSQYRRSHHHNNQLRNALYPNELPHEEENEDEQVDDREEMYMDEENEVENEDDDEQPLNLGRPANMVEMPPRPAPVSAKSRDHPEIVSILSRQPKSNVVMLAAADLRKLVGIDTL